VLSSKDSAPPNQAQKSPVRGTEFPKSNGQLVPLHNGVPKLVEVSPQSGLASGLAKLVFSRLGSTTRLVPKVTSAALLLGGSKRSPKADAREASGVQLSYLTSTVQVAVAPGARVPGRQTPSAKSPPQLSPR
jgi:hypothetical protein